CARLLDDDGVDAAIVGCVPLTPALNTLAPGAAHREDLARDDGVVTRLASLWNRTRKPWVMVVDGGALYDPMAAALGSAGIPVFRTADRALRAFSRWAMWRLAGPRPQAAPAVDGVR
ncbi:MAG TPA: hypothetical protein VLV48_01920, partial [Thermoanaerobaculia bacterium]|nr:hypothetical protein [Thermoanaerobaculia bacterium]